MQQYFSSQTLNSGDVISLDKEDLYHIKTVLRKTDGYLFRIVDQNGSVFYCTLHNNKGIVGERLSDINELPCKVTVILSLIKFDKYDLCLQKLTELGVYRIVPYQAKRSVVKINDQKKIDRFRKIVKEAAQQSHRNFIPEVTECINFSSISNYLSDVNYIAYENERSGKIVVSNDSLTIIIGPEGGFDEEEYKKIVSLGFKSVTLGNRILRAETAAIFAMSLIGGQFI